MSNESSFDGEYDAGNENPFSPLGFEKNSKNTQNLKKSENPNIVTLARKGDCIIFVKVYFMIRYVF